MKNVTTVLVAAAIGAAAIGIGIAPPAAADTSNCQQVGASTVCGQGDVRGADQSPDAETAEWRAVASSGARGVLERVRYT